MKIRTVGLLRPRAPWFAVAVMALVLALVATPHETLAKKPPNEGVLANAAASVPVASISEASSANSVIGPPKPASTVSKWPRTEEQIYNLNRREIVLIKICIVALTLLGGLVSLYPVVQYVWVTWDWREHIIGASLTATQKDQYLNYYHRENSNVASADARFNAFYRQWFGRSRLIAAANIMAALVFVYTFFLACCAAQALYGQSIVYLPLNHHVVKIAIAAVAGAYTMVSFDTITRVVRRDLLPEDLYVSSLRLVACVPVAYSLASFVKDDAAMVVAFATSTLSLQFIADFLRKNLSSRLGVKSDDPKSDDPISLLSGVDASVAERISGIGVTTIWQLAESDPVQLTMRTNLSFTFVLELTSQAIAWTYLEAKIKDLRSMGLGGAYELGVLNIEAHTPGSPYQENAGKVMEQAAEKLGLKMEAFKNVLYEIGDDPRTKFLLDATNG